MNNGWIKLFRSLREWEWWHERYVCCLYGKRIDEEPEVCKGFQAGANKRQMEG